MPKIQGNQVIYERMRFHKIGKPLLMEDTWEKRKNIKVNKQNCKKIAIFAIQRYANGFSPFDRPGFIFEFSGKNSTFIYGKSISGSSLFGD